MEFKYSDGIFSIISLDKDGILLVRDREKYESGKKLWEIILLDSNLQEQKKLTLPLESRNKLVGYDHRDGNIYLLYRMGESVKSDVELHKIGMRDSVQESFIIKPELALNFTHFVIAGNSAVLGGYVNKDPSVVLFDMEAKHLKVLPGFFQKDSELLDLRVNVNNTINVVLIDRAVRNERKMILHTYDQDGNILLEDRVDIENRRTLQTGITSTLKREDMLLAGAWGEGNAKQANGFYALPIDPFGKQKIQYFAFGELEHYLDFQKESRAQRIKEKSREEVKAGGVPNYVNYVMPYRVEEFEQGYLLYAEVYQPSTTYSNNGPMNPYFNPYFSPYGWYYPSYGRLYSRPYSYGYNSRSNSDEIKVYASSLIAFDPAGNVLWDRSLDLDEIKVPTLEQVVDFHYEKDEVYFVYKKESDIFLKWTNVVTGDKEEFTEKVRMAEDQDEIRSEREDEGGTVHWFNNVFYVWGYQTIRNNTKEDRTRDVFYINKVVAK